jgi:hypothetical protein
MFLTNVVEKIEEHIVCPIKFFFFENGAVNEIMCKNIVERDRPQMTTWRTRIACWVPKATNTHTGCVMLLLFHSNNGCKNAPLCYAVGTLAVLFTYVL